MSGACSESEALGNPPDLQARPGWAGSCRVDAWEISSACVDHKAPRLQTGLLGAPKALLTPA